MKNHIKILFTIALTLSFILSACSSSVNNTQKTPGKKTRTTNKTPDNNPVAEELSQDSALLPLTLEAIEAGTIFISGKENRKLFIQKNDDGIEPAYDSISVKPGDKIRFYGYDYVYIDEDQYLRINCSAACYVYGNVMSLLEYTHFAGKKEINKAYSFQNLFYCNTKIKNHETLDIILPATTLALHCYDKMFAGCSGLTRAPELPATNLADCCYYGMFKSCFSLTTAPELPATKLVPACYNNMFANCNSLTKAPALPATTLNIGCYQSMFFGCSSLSTAPELPATTLDVRCYCDMFNGCKSLTTAPVLPATTLATSCYRQMFATCESLTTAPVLPATTLADYCYNMMFYGCKSLNSVTCLATDISATSCNESWLYGVSATGTFVKAAEMTSWTSGVNGIPDGWTVVNAD